MFDVNVNSFTGGPKSLFAYKNQNFAIFANLKIKTLSLVTLVAKFKN